MVEKTGKWSRRLESGLEDWNVVKKTGKWSGTLESGLEDWKVV